MTDNPAQLAPYVALGAFALAFVFGAVANKTEFCTMGAVSDWVNMGSLNRMRMWLLAIGVAILGSNALHLGDSPGERRPAQQFLGALELSLGAAQVAQVQT